MEGPMISVIVPVYNAEKYLRRCLDSLRGQTYHNMEFVLVDDGSSDKSSEICDQYTIKDARFCVHHQENSGAAAARNAGLAVAKGDWIGFVDSDDYVEPDMYAYLLELAQRHNADIAQCGIIWEESTRQMIQDIPERDMSITLSDLAPSKIWKCFSNSSSNKIFFRERIGTIQFNSEYVIGEDFLFNLEVLNRATRIVFGTKAAYHYVQNVGSICHTSVDNRTIESMRNMLLYAETLFPMRESFMQYCKDQRLRNNFDICSKIVCEKKVSKYNKLLISIQKEMRFLMWSGYKTCLFTKKEKLKCFLIGYLWPIYQFLLPKWKKWLMK